MALSENWTDFHSAVDSWRRQTVYYAAIQSEGRGRVTALPGFDDPLVTYRLTSGDRARLRTGLARLIHLMQGAGARTVYPSYAGAPVVTDRTEAVGSRTSVRTRGGEPDDGSPHRHGADGRGHDAKAGLTRSAACTGSIICGSTTPRLLPWAPWHQPARHA
ncbi:MAG: hypothetical protein WKF73_13070 [Nocardioidaceae bacterium]